MKKQLERLFLFFILTIFSFTVLAQKSKRWDLPVNSNSKEAVKLFDKGLEALDNVQLAKAQKLFKEAAYSDPGFFMPNNYLALLSMYFGNKMQLQVHSTNALGITGGLSDGELLMQNALKKLVESKENDVTLLGEKLVQLYPTSLGAHQMLATYQMFAGKPEAVNKTYMKMLDLSDNDAPIYNGLGYNYMNLNMMDKAKKAFETYLDLEPDNANVYDSMGDYYAKADNSEKAFEYYMKAFETDRVNFRVSFNKAKKIKPMLFLGLFSPHVTNYQLVKGKVKELKYQSFHTRLENGKKTKGEPYKFSEAFLEEYLQSWSYQYDENGKVLKMSSKLDDGSTLLGVPHYEKNKIVRVYWLKDDTLSMRYDIEYDQNIVRKILVNAEKGKEEMRYVYELDKHGNVGKYHFKLKNGDIPYPVKFTRDNKGRITTMDGRNDKGEMWNFYVDYVYNDHDLFVDLTMKYLTGKEVNRKTKHGMQYEYDEKGNWIKAVGNKHFTERKIIYYE